MTQNGPVSKVYFDTLNREIRVETQGFDGSGTATTIYVDTQYDSLGRPYKISRPYYAGQSAYWSTSTYDLRGRKTGMSQSGWHEPIGVKPRIRTAGWGEWSKSRLLH